MINELMIRRFYQLANLDTSSVAALLSNRQNQRRVRALLFAIGKTKEECGHFSLQSAKPKKSAGTPLRNRQNVRREGDFFLGIGRTKEEETIVWCPVIAYRFEFGGRRAVGGVYDRAYFVDSRRTGGHRPPLQFAIFITYTQLRDTTPESRARATYQSRCRDRFVAKRVFNRPARP